MKGNNTQISKIAKELELSTQKILDFLQKEHPTVDVGKGFFSKVDDEAYGFILKKFNPEGFKNFNEKRSEEGDDHDKLKDAQKKQVGIKSRIPEIDEILSSNPKDSEDERNTKRSRRKIKEDEEITAPVKETAPEVKQETAEKVEPAPVEQPKGRHIPRPYKPESDAPQPEPVRPAAAAQPSASDDRKPYVKKPYQRNERDSAPDQQRTDRGFKKELPKSPAAATAQSPAKPASESTDSGDKKSKLKKKTDDKDSIKEDKAAKGNT